MHIILNVKHNQNMAKKLHPNRISPEKSNYLHPAKLLCDKIITNSISTQCATLSSDPDVSPFL
jgi:hypothetical protein